MFPASSDGDEIDLQILSAIDQTWTAQHGAAGLNYSTYETAGFFQFHNPSEILFTEDSDMATYGSVIFGTTVGNNTSYGCDSASTIGDQFAASGILSGSGSSCSGSDLAALSRSLHSVSQTRNASVTFAVGFDREHAINYLNETQTGLHRTRWPTVGEAISFFLEDYTSAYKTSVTFDAEVRSKSESVSDVFGSQYADIVEASVRQTFGEPPVIELAGLS